jgi:dihydrofolate synthase/folylpolyglutamate synthase
MDLDKKYQETLDYLYSFVDYSLTRQTRYLPEQFDLGRMFSFMEYLGNPHLACPVIHVAGTKGKGSVSAMCESVLRAAGMRVGFYTSPHLQDYPERIQVNREYIPVTDLIALVDEVRPYLDRGTQLTTFEITTALGFLYFARQGVDCAVIEVGLGGRLDATNVVKPLLSVITSLSLDHMKFLGDTLAEIAAEKAGIIKPGVPVIISPQNEEARLVIERIADENEAPLIEVGRDYLFAEVSHSLTSGQVFQVWSKKEQHLVDEYIESAGLEEWEPVRLQIPLLGYHQIENAATAYTALKVASTMGIPISEGDIKRGFSQVSWPGRFEILQSNPPVVIDSAHNRYSALKLRLALDDYYPGVPVILVFGASEDKDVEGMFAELMPRVRRVIAARSYHPRAMDPERIQELARRYARPAIIIEEVQDAVREAICQAKGEALVLVTGSFFIAAGARETWPGIKVPVNKEKVYEK